MEDFVMSSGIGSGGCGDFDLIKLYGYDGRFAVGEDGEEFLRHGFVSFGLEAGFGFDGYSKGGFSAVALELEYGFEVMAFENLGDLS
jgi:hypothetical protein